MFIKSLKPLLACFISSTIVACSGTANAGIHIDVHPTRVVRPVSRVVVVNPVRRVVVKRVVVASRPAPMNCAIRPGHWSHGVWIAQHKNCWVR